MKEIDDLIDKYEGMLDLDLAEKLYDSKYDEVPYLFDKKVVSVEKLTNYLYLNLSGKPYPHLYYLVNLSDHVYRIFNKSKFKNKRLLVMGDSPDTISVMIKNKNDTLDRLKIYHNDKIIIKNLLVNMDKKLFYANDETEIKRVSQSKPPISNFGFLAPKIRNLDILGKVEDVCKLECGNGKDFFMKLKLKDMIGNVMNLIAEDSSALSLEGIKKNQYVRLEFAKTKLESGKIYILADDDSRVIKYNQIKK